MKLIGETCAIHSLGFIDLDGNFIDLQKEGGMVHIDWLISKFGRHEAANFGWYTPPGWIKVSNAYVMTIKAFSWESIKPKQIDALIEMWMSCAKYSPWIRKANSKLLEFWSDSGPQEFTLGDFLKYLVLGVRTS